MTGVRVCLTLVADRAIQPELFDFLAGQRELVSGFTASDAAGYGHTVHLDSPAEQVRGRADRVLVRIVIDDAAAGELLGRLRETFRGAHLTYWTSEVRQFGVIE